MVETTTIAISKSVQKKLMELIHKLEDTYNRRYSYSDAIKYLFDNNGK